MVMEGGRTWSVWNGNVKQYTQGHYPKGKARKCKHASVLLFTVPFALLTSAYIPQILYLGF